MWSLVIVKDIFRELKKVGTLDPAVATSYPNLKGFAERGVP